MGLWYCLSVLHQPRHVSNVPRALSAQMHRDGWACISAVVTDLGTSIGWSVHSAPKCGSYLPGPVRGVGFAPKVMLPAARGCTLHYMHPRCLTVSPLQLWPQGLDTGNPVACVQTASKPAKPCTHIVTNTVCPLPCCSYGMKGWALEFAHDFDKSTAGPVVGLSKRLGSSGATVAATCDTGKRSVVPGGGGAPNVDCWANLIGAL